LTLADPVRTLDAVAEETPAARATSASVGGTVVDECIRDAAVRDAVTDAATEDTTAESADADGIAGGSSVCVTASVEATAWGAAMGAAGSVIVTAYSTFG
jgi:hypothetical protein